MTRLAQIKLWGFLLLLALGQTDAQTAPSGGAATQPPPAPQSSSNPCPPATPQPTPAPTPTSAPSPSPTSQSTNSGQQATATPSSPILLTVTSPTPVTPGENPAVPKPLPDKAVLDIVPLAQGKANAADIAKALTGTPGVISVVPIGDSKLVFVLTDETQKTTIEANVAKLAADKPAGPPSSSPAPSSASKPSSGKLFYAVLPRGAANAPDIAAALTNVPGIISAAALTDRKLLFVLDTTPKVGSQPTDTTSLEDQIDETVGALASPRPSTSLKPTVPVVPYVAKLPDRTGNAPDIASKLAGAIPGVINITPIGNTRILFLLDNTPDPKSPNKPRDNDALEKKLGKIVVDLALPYPQIHIPPFPLANGKNCDIMNALAKQIPGVLNISPVGNAYLAFSIDPDFDSDALHRKIDTLVSTLAEPVSVPRSPDTNIVVQRLYYNHDPTSVAAVIDAAFPDVKASPILPDTVFLSTTLGRLRKAKGDPLEDARRALAAIDQPKPQVSLETWSIQVSADRAHAIEEVEPHIRETASRYNKIMGHSLQAGWHYLVDRLSVPGFLDQDFSDYLTQQTYAWPEMPWEPCCYQGNDIYTPPPYLPMPFPLPQTTRGYALGYTTLFRPLSPNLIYMLVALAASTRPSDNADHLINVIESGTPAPEPYWDPYNTCQKRDTVRYGGHPEELQLECVREVLTGQFFAQNTLILATASNLGRFRASVADFLFQYKMTVEYPKDFHPYLAAEAAAKLDAELSPIVSAFNRDLEVFQQRMRAEIEGPDLFKRNHITYASTGIVSVKVVAGTAASVQTTTLNYFDATPTPTLADLAAAIRSIGMPSPAPASQSNNTSTSSVGQPSSGKPATQLLLPTILTSNISANEAVAALAAVQALTRTPVSAKIGKGLTLNATAYSLSGAAGAEMDVAVESNENGAELMSAATATNSNSQVVQTDDLASRVSDHKVMTRVRVDSMNLFELSTMEAVLARGKAPWKPVDPVLEVPLLGDLIRVPRKPALTYHRSFIFINALIVPTAADLGNGIPLQEDVVVKPSNPSILNRAKRLDDLGMPGADRIWPYHQAVVNWLSSQYIDANGNVQSGILKPEFVQFPLH